MDWIWDNGRVFYRPLQDFCKQQLYTRCLDLCWCTDYLILRRIMTKFLLLHIQMKVPVHLTTELLAEWLVECGNKADSVSQWRRCVLEMEDSNWQSLLMMTWDLNIALKLGDIDFEARMLLASPESDWASSEPIEEVIELLVKKKREQPSSSLLSFQQVVVELIPRVLQRLWDHPHNDLTMPSRDLSDVAIGIAKAVMDKLPDLQDRKVRFPKKDWDEKVLEIVGKVAVQFKPHQLTMELILTGPKLLKAVVNIMALEVRLMLEAVKADASPAEDILDVNTEECDLNGDQNNAHDLDGVDGSLGPAGEMDKTSPVVQDSTALDTAVGPIAPAQGASPTSMVDANSCNTTDGVSKPKRRLIYRLLRFFCCITSTEDVD